MDRRALLLSAIALAGGAVPAARSALRPQAAADLLAWNANVLTVDKSFSRAQAVAIRRGVFAAVGTNEDVKKQIGPSTRVIDAQGRTVVPGLIETHVHATGAARGEAMQEFVQLHSIRDIQDWVRARAKEVPPATWIQVPRVDFTRIREGRIPIQEELDVAAPNHPTVCTWEYGSLTQIQVFNSAGIKAAGLTKDTPAPAGGRIERRPTDSSPESWRTAAVGASRRRVRPVARRRTRTHVVRILVSRSDSSRLLRSPRSSRSSASRSTGSRSSTTSWSRSSAGHGRR